VGYLLIAIAACLISIGSYILSYALSVERPGSVLGLFQGINFVRLFAGVLLSLAGSIFWAGGRARFEAYFHAWNLYLILLVVFGFLISVLIRKDPMNLTQGFGVLLAAVSISLMSRG